MLPVEFEEDGGLLPSGHAPPPAWLLSDHWNFCLNQGCTPYALLHTLLGVADFTWMPAFMRFQSGAAGSDGWPKGHRSLLAAGGAMEGRRI
ncbi:hypothetical protein ACLOJK_004628 [Asimina triloba]